MIIPDFAVGLYKEGDDVECRPSGPYLIVQVFKTYNRGYRYIFRDGKQIEVFEIGKTKCPGDLLGVGSPPLKAFIGNGVTVVMNEHEVKYMQSIATRCFYVVF